VSSRHSELATPRATIETLQRFGLSTKKRLGQHFLIDDNIIGRILDAADLSQSDTILEVGPGIGTLTVALLKHAGQILAIEKDPALMDALLHTTANNPRLTILNADALNLPTLTLPTTPTKLVANLPYQVAATIVLDCFEYLLSITRATVMVQREVAERMAARPATKAYGAYTAKLALLAKVTATFPVSRQSFLPPPRVDSTVITLERCSHDEEKAGECVQSLEHYRAVAALIDAAFANRRKTILNNLKQWKRGVGVSSTTPQDVVCGVADKNDEDGRGTLTPLSLLLEDALQQAGISASARAETLTPADFIRLYQTINREG